MKPKDQIIFPKTRPKVAVVELEPIMKRAENFNAGIYKPFITMNDSKAGKNDQHGRT